MSGGRIAAVATPTTSSSSLFPAIISSISSSCSRILPLRSSSCYVKPKTPLVVVVDGGGYRRRGGLIPTRLGGIQCSSSSNSNKSGVEGGEDGSRSILDAFFLGKAVAEAINERLESTVGELLSTVGRLQAEQQKQVQEFQEDVLERAKRAREKAAAEAMEAHGRFPKSSATASTTVSSTADTIITEVDISSSSTDPTGTREE